MSQVLNLTRAARLVGVSRSVLQKKIQSGELEAPDGMVTVDSLLRCYPDAQLEDDVEFRRISQIKERAFGKRVFERALPDVEVLAARVTELSKTLASSEAQNRQLNKVFANLWDRLNEFEQQGNDEVRSAMQRLEFWIRQELAAARERAGDYTLAVRESVLRVMTAQVTVLPSRHDFLVEGQDTLLEAAMRAGIPLNYGCSGGNCGLCKARVVSGEVKKIRHHDFVLSEADKSRGCVLLCSNTAVSDVVIEADVAGGVQDIPFQQIQAKVKSVEPLTDNMLLLHVQTPRSQRLRFLAGQSVAVRVGQSYTADLPIASCPCDDRNVLFHLRRLPGNLFFDYVFERLKSNDTVDLEGPQGEFILHEKSTRPLYFFAFDDGFAPIKSLIEHAMSLEVQAIHLYWTASTPAHIYLPNVPRAWADALDNFHFESHITGFDLREMHENRAAALRAQLHSIVASDTELMQGDMYLAGPETAVAIAEEWFIGLGLPKSRVFVGAMR
jgi:CDP-4-dehydro-6-deoxyglucose reductase